MIKMLTTVVFVEAIVIVVLLIICIELITADKDFSSLIKNNMSASNNYCAPGKINFKDFLDKKYSNLVEFKGKNMTVLRHPTCPKPPSEHILAIYNKKCNRQRKR